MSLSTEKIFNSTTHADVFDEYRSLPFYILRKWEKIILNQISSTLNDSKIIGDAGAGTGRFSIPIAKSVEPFGYTILAIEKSPEMLGKLMSNAENQLVHNIIPQLSELVSFRYEKPLGGIFISEVIHLLTDLKGLCEALYENLDSNGWLVIRTMSHEQLKKIEWLNFFPKALEIDLNRTADVKEISSMLHDTGFKKIVFFPVEESQYLNSSFYREMLLKKAFSILYSFSETDLQQGYQRLTEYCNDKNICKHTMEFTCIIACK